MEKVNYDVLQKKWIKLSTTGKQKSGLDKNFNPLNNVPDWFDAKRFKNAQKLSKKYFFSLNIAHFIGNILLVLLPDIHIPIVATGRSSTVYDVLKRVLSTVIHVNSWYEDNPFDPKSSTYQSLRQVRYTCHMAVTKLMNEKYPKDKKYAHIDENNLWLSQFDMVMTQWSLIGPIVIKPNNCAFYIENQKLNCLETLIKDPNNKFYVLNEMIYFWRVIGYCMGINDEFNCCGQENFFENVEFIKICFEKGYKPHLSDPNPLVKNGLRLVNGLFLGLNFIIPNFIISNNAFMRYWYNCLDIKHEFHLNKLSVLCSYVLHVILFDYLMRFRFIYDIVSFAFFKILSTLLVKVNQLEFKIKQNYANENYNVYDDYGQIYSICNTVYKSNV